MHVFKLLLYKRFPAFYWLKIGGVSSSIKKMSVFLFAPRIAGKQPYLCILSLDLLNYKSFFCKGQVRMQFGAWGWEPFILNGDV